MSAVPQVQPAPRSHREWAAAAERADLETIAGEMTVDPDSSFTAMMVTLGPKFYVRRVSERFARQLGFIIMSVRRAGNLVNPLTACPIRCHRRTTLKRWADLMARGWA